MNIQWLYSFIAAAQSGSFTHAAEQLYTTQSAVSKHIHALERELGVSLFDRSRRCPALTAEGEIVLAQGKRIVAQYESMRAMLQRSHKEQLNIASIPVMAQYRITSILADFNRQYPLIELDIQEREASVMQACLENGQFSLAFCRRELLNEEDYHFIDIAEDRMVAVLPKTHALAAQSSVCLAQLSNESFLLMHQNTKLYDLCLKACQQAGFTPRVSYTGTRSENIIGLVAKGMGIALLMEQSVAYINPDDVMILPLKEQIGSMVSMVRLKKQGLTSAAQCCWDYVQNMKLNLK